MDGNYQVSDAAESFTLTTCTVSTTALDGDVSVAIAGELDMADAEKVGKVLADAAKSCKSTLRVGLRDLTFADSSAVRALLLGSMAAAERGVDFEIVDAHTGVRRLLEVSGLTEALNVVGNSDG